MNNVKRIELLELNGKNYRQWSFKVLNLLGEKSLAGMALGTATTERDQGKLEVVRCQTLGIINSEPNP